MCPDLRVNEQEISRVSHSHACMSNSHSLSEAFASKDSKCASHVREHPRAMFVIIGKERDAGQADSLGDGLQCSLFFRLAIVLHAHLLGLWRRNDIGGDS